ncbi:MAG: hypothetical protein AB7O96_08980 [Pseudobdellovibrionaceae bacterium]
MTWELKRFFILMILLFSPNLFASVQSDLAKIIRHAQLEKYEKAGSSVKRSVKLLFKNELDSPQIWSATPVETWDFNYSEKIKPGVLENLTEGQTEQGQHDLQIFYADVNRALALKTKFKTSYRSNPHVRKKLQNIFIGLLHVLDVKIRVHIDSSLDDLIRLRRFLLTQGTFYSSGKNAKLRLDDIWWDLLWLRGLSYSHDLVELHLEKVAAIANKQDMQWKSRLDRYYVALSLMVLKKNPGIVSTREKPFAVSLRIAHRATEKAEQMDFPQAVVKELKLDLYKYLTQSGQSHEARQLKKEIAMDLFFEKGRNVFTHTLEPWDDKKIDVIEKTTSSVSHFFETVLVFITYGIGFIFVATPIELILVLSGLFILAHQGHHFFGTQRKSFKKLWKQHRIFTKKGIRKLPNLMRDSWDLTREDFRTAWKMFVASYTSAGVPFYSKVAASLLMFGVGLYFNSARSMVETVMSQMAMLN